MVRGDVWWASTTGGERPVLILTRDPVADRIDGVVVAPCTRTIRGLLSEVTLGPEDGMPERCVVSFDNLHTLRRRAFRRFITRLSDARMDDACRVLQLALGCAGSARSY
ncbi:MAG: type II toxin-antitoxin system PemK/MazF family toxin [Candidatus Dormibacteria bacterium]